MGEEQSKEKKKEKQAPPEVPKPRGPAKQEPIPYNVPFNPTHPFEEHTVNGKRATWQHPKPPEPLIARPKPTVVVESRSQREIASKVVNPEQQDSRQATKILKNVVPHPKPEENTPKYIKPSTSKKSSVPKQTVMDRTIKVPPELELPLKKELSNHSEGEIKLQPRQNIPIVTTPSKIKINLTGCMFFKQGCNSMYTYDAMQLLIAGAGRSVWISLSNPDQLMESKIDVMKALKTTAEELEVLSQLGTFVLAQEKWGFLIELEQLDCIYEGGVSHILSRCVRIPFFQYLMKRYAFYMLEDKSITLRDLLSTENDRRLSNEELSRCEILFPHQQEEVGWMLNLERRPVMSIEVNSMIPLFDSGYFFDPLDKSVTLRKIKDLKEQNTEKVPIRGAILASDIGSGKTASMLYLIYMSHLFDRTEKPTLIITPDSILFQWIGQLKKFTPSLNLQFMERPIEVDQFKLLPNTNVVILPRSALVKLKNNPLRKIAFKRIIIDEVHEIVKSLQKEKSHDHPQYFLEYQAEMVWGVTGTPHQVDYLSNLTVLGRLLRFPQKIYDELSIDIFRRCFLEYCIRKNANTALLPPVTKEVVYSQMQVVDNILYSAKSAFALDEEQARKICFNILPAFELTTGKSTIETGISVVKQRLNNEITKVQMSLAKYTEQEPGRKTLLDKLHRLTSQSNFYNEIIGILGKQQFECFICLEDKEISKLVLTQCFHYCCDECYGQFFRMVLINQCPVCKTQITKEKAIIHPNMKHSKNKIDKIMEALANVKKGEKTIIFTQFHNLVERIAQEFKKAAVPFLELRGEPSEINYRLNIFRNDPDIQVLLLSIEQAASGINLTQANHVFFAHPILGNEYETMIRTYQQCIGRVSRIGQTKPVSAKLFVGQGTLEASYHNYFMRNK